MYLESTQKNKIVVVPVSGIDALEQPVSQCGKLVVLCAMCYVLCRDVCHLYVSVDVMKVNSLLLIAALL